MGTISISQPNLSLAKPEHKQAVKTILVGEIKLKFPLNSIECKHILTKPPPQIGLIGNYVCLFPNLTLIQCTIWTSLLFSEIFASLGKITQTCALLSRDSQIP